MSMSCNLFLLPQHYGKVGIVDNKNIARQVHFKVCYTTQRFVPLVLQRRREIARQVAKQIAECNCVSINVIVHYNVPQRTCRSIFGKSF